MQEEKNKISKKLSEKIKLAYENLTRDLVAAKNEHRDRINALANRIKERRVREIQDKLKSF